VYLAEGPWSINAARDMFKEIEFHVSSELNESDRVVDGKDTA
jgi:hypothetical protein